MAAPCVGFLDQLVVSLSLVPRLHKFQADLESGTINLHRHRSYKIAALTLALCPLKVAW